MRFKTNCFKIKSKKHKYGGTSMKGFVNDRKWIIEKKNDIAIRAMDNKDKTDQFIEKKNEIEEGISRIPTDLPDEIQRQVDAAIENIRHDLNEEGEELEQEASEISEDADEVMDTADSISDDLKEKGNKLKELNGIPILGNFADAKGEEVLDQADQIIDLRQETQQYQDDLLASKNRLMNHR